MRFISYESEWEGERGQLLYKAYSGALVFFLHSGRVLLWVLSDRLKAEAGLRDLVSAIAVRRRRGEEKEKPKKRQKREAGDPNEEQRVTAKSLVCLRYSRNLRKGYKKPTAQKPQSTHQRIQKETYLTPSLFTFPLGD